MRTKTTLLSAALVAALIGAPACKKDGPTPGADNASKTLAKSAAAPAKTTEPSGPAAVGKPAPDFSLTGIDGKVVSLSDYKGKTVVLEWFNPGCPFVVMAHEKGPLKDLAKKVTSTGVAWLAVNSGGPGLQGHGAAANKAGAVKWAMDHPVLLDEAGAVGKAYGATNTPHLYVIDGAGTLVYAGALDSTRGGGYDEGGEFENYVSDALDALAAGKSIKTPSTKAWGCSVKYGS